MISASVASPHQSVRGDGRLKVDPALADGDRGEMRARARLAFLARIGEMIAHRAHCQADQLADLAVGMPMGEQIDAVDLAAGDDWRGFASHAVAVDALGAVKTACETMTRNARS